MNLKFGSSLVSDRRQYMLGLIAGFFYKRLYSCFLNGFLFRLFLLIMVSASVA